MLLHKRTIWRKFLGRALVLVLSGLWLVSVSAVESRLGQAPAPAGADPTATTTAPTKTPPNLLAQEDAATILGWIIDNKPTNLCHGSYQESAAMLAYPTPPPMKGTPINIVATQNADLFEAGKSTVTGDVTITQPGREVIADKLTFWRDEKSGKIVYGTLVGNVHFREYGKLMVAENGSLDFTKDLTTFNNAIYRTTAPNVDDPRYISAESAWGRAKQAIRDALGVLHFTHATYTTCAPTTNSWHLVSSTLTLDKKAGWGKAVNSVLYAGAVPIAYFPYLNFPIDSRRKSGFLFPTIAHSSNGSWEGVFPYYFNLAPNYDLTLTPHLISKRGVFTEAEGRYLTKDNIGDLQGGFIPNDSAFYHFKQTALGEYPAGHALSRLEGASLDRGYFSWQDTAVFNQHWGGDLKINQVSDDYFVNDFGLVPGAVATDQLLNQADLTYGGDHWNFLGKLQAFQTLHTSDIDNKQYLRLPEFDLAGNYPDALAGLDYQLNSQLVRFDRGNNFATNLPVVTGDRVFVAPTISLPMNYASGYVTPKITLNALSYNLQNQAAGVPAGFSEAIPSFSLDSGLILQRAFNFLKNSYTQTLEPRLFYLFVPEHNQSVVPDFDTTLPPFDFDSMFRDNRFSGVDRIGDANQVVAAVTTRFLDGATGDEKMDMSVGQMYLFEKHRLCLNSPDPACESYPGFSNQLAPLVGALNYNLNAGWTASAGAAWEWNTKQLNNDSLSLRYMPAADRILNVSYNFASDADTFLGETKNLQRLDLSMMWPIKQNWHALADWNYNFSFSRAESYTFGVQYDSCCWAVRVVTNRNFVSVDPHNNLVFENRFFVQFLLKGLGGVGMSTADLLQTHIAGYTDNFRTKPNL